MSANTLVHFSSVSPPGYELDFGLWGDAAYEPVSTSSSGGVQIVDRPRLVAATQWYDRSPMQLTLDLVLNTEINGGESVEFECQAVDGFQDKAPGYQQPPIFSISGPVAGQQRQWIMYSVKFTDAIRDPTAGFRTQQELTIIMYEYNSPLSSVVGNPTPAQAATAALNASEASESYTLYTVSAGDNLVSIASNLLNNWVAWVEIADLNNIRDPNNVTPGQVIKIPQP